MSFSSDTRRELMIKACYYYYERELTQTKIAEMLGVSRLTLGNLLKDAKSSGIVKIEIEDTENLTAMMKLETALCEKFSLSSAVVTDTVDNSKDVINSSIAKAGASLISRLIKSDMKISVSWGETINLMTKKLPYDSSVKNIEVVTLLGGAATTGASVQPGMVAGALLDHYEGKGYVLNAPFVCQSELSCSSFKSESNYISISEKWLESDLYLVGIGEMPSLNDDYWAKDCYSQDTIKQIISCGAVGDICGSYFDRDGCKCCKDVDIRRLGIDINDLKKRKNVIALAGGENKIVSINASLKGHFIDTLVTDKNTAISLLSI